MAFKFYTGGKLIVREGGASFSPANLGSLNLWLDASDSSKIAVSAPNIVSTVTDKSSNGYVFNVGGPGNVGTNIGNMNGLNTIEFDGSSYLLSSSPFIVGNNFSMFVVAEIDSVDNVNDSLISMRGGSGPNWQIDAGAGANKFNIRIFNTTSTANLTTKVFSASHEPGPAVFELIFNLTANTAEVLLDGVSLGTTPYINATGAGNSLSIFANRALTQRIDGRVGEVIATSSVLTNSQRQKVEGYLAEKWGLSLQNSHPYKNGLPRATTFYINKPTQEYSFNISIRDTQANILSRNNDPVGTIAYATDTFNLLVKQVDGYDEFTVVDDDDRELGQYSFNIDIRLTKAEILARNNDPVGTIAYATDTAQILIKEIDGYDSFTLINPHALSLHFNGSNDSLKGSANSSINFSGDLTISAWVRQDTLKHGGILAVGEESANGSTYPGMFHVHTSPTKLQFIAQDSSGSASIIKTATTPTVNQWVHILISAQSGVTNGTNIYLNGSLDKTGTTFINAATGTVKVFIGKKSYDDNHVDGFIDEVAIFNSALSASDAANIYNSGVPIDLGSNGLNLSPVGWWRMGDTEGGTGTTITDQGSGGNNVSFVNNPTFSEIVPPQNA